MNKNKILIISGKILIWLFLSILILVSILPLVQWWAGVLAFIILTSIAILSFLKPELKEKLNDKPYIGWLKAVVVVFFFGFIMHMGCSIYSDIKVAEFTDDAHKEKDNVFKKTKAVQPPNKVIQNLNKLYQKKANTGE